MYSMTRAAVQQEILSLKLSPKQKPKSFQGQARAISNLNATAVADQTIMRMDG